MSTIQTYPKGKSKTKEKAGRQALLLLLVLCLLITPTVGSGRAMLSLPPVDGGFEALAGRVGRAEAWQQYVASSLEQVASELSEPMPEPMPSSPTSVLTPRAYLPLVVRTEGSMVERRALWVTRYDWTRFNQTPAPEAVDTVVARAAGAGFNTLFFQVRAAGDAYYASSLEPWAARLTGSTWATLGQDPGWDPLARMIAQAHARGMEVHAYVNVYPAWQSPYTETYGELWPPATLPPQMFDRFTYGPDYAAHPGEHGLGYTWRHYSAPDAHMPLRWNAYLWATPGRDEVQDHVVAVVSEILTRYPVDGIHLDLVRYAGRSYSFDPASNAAAGETPSAARAQWQRDRVTDLVARVQTTTAALRPEAWVTAAVWPYYEDRWGWGVSEGYHDYHQDSQGWLAAGIVDGIAPMLYGGALDFSRWLTLTADFVGASASGHVYPGIGVEADFEGIVQRIEAARAVGAPGHALFSYGALESYGFWDDLAAGPYVRPARVPERP